VTCDKNKIDKKGCHGAPDWVIEIASPSTAKRDIGIKLQEYKKAGVREYWIVDPDTKTVSVHAFQTDAPPANYTFSDKIKAGIYEQFEIDFAEITSDLTY
jgi:Uma2 family endonuclease